MFSFFYGLWFPWSPKKLYNNINQNLGRWCACVCDFRNRPFSVISFFFCCQDSFLGCFWCSATYHKFAEQKLSNNKSWLKKSFRLIFLEFLLFSNTVVVTILFLCRHYFQYASTKARLYCIYYRNNAKIIHTIWTDVMQRANKRVNVKGFCMTCSWLLHSNMCHQIYRFVYFFRSYNEIYFLFKVSECLSPTLLLPELLYSCTVLPYIEFFLSTTICIWKWCHVNVSQSTECYSTLYKISIFWKAAFFSLCSFVFRLSASVVQYCIYSVR